MTPLSPDECVRRVRMCLAHVIRCPRSFSHDGTTRCIGRRWHRGGCCEWRYESAATPPRERLTGTVG